MKLVFKVHNEYLLAHSLGTRQPVPFRGWGILKDEMWKKYPEAYSFLMGRSEAAFASEEKLDEVMEKVTRNLPVLFREILVSNEFQRLLKETEKYCVEVEEQWRRNEREVRDTLEDLLGFELPKRKIIVLVTHPKLHNGIHFSDKNIIGWGHPEDWQNYSTVYLAHELLHFMIEDKLGTDDAAHAIIELVTDNELRIRLNGEGEYFKENSEDVGHGYLRDLEKKILPEWRKYLKRKHKKIEEFYRKIEKQ